MASFERYSSPSRGGSSSETRFESWAVAHSKNCSEQNLLKNRLKELDRQRARSLFVLSMERKCVKKDHNKLLMDRRTLVNSPHFGESSSSRMTPMHPALNIQSGNGRIQERVNSWKNEMARRCQSASPRILSATPTESDIDQPTPNQLSSENTVHVPQRPVSTVNMYSNTADRSVTRDREAILSDVDEQRAISSTNHGPNSEPMSPRRRVRRAETDRQVQSKISRLRMLSRVPADINLRAKTLSVSRSRQPQISLKYFDEQNEKGKSHVKAKDSQAQSRRKTHQNGR